MPKAILITAGNVKELESNYGLEDGELEGYEGLTLVADFGDPGMIAGYLSEVAMKANYIKTGVKLENGYYEVARPV